jgi:hypothetical protein
MKYFSSGEGLTAFPLWLKLPRRFTKQRPGRLFFVLVEGAQRDRAEQPGKQVVARCLSTIHQTRMVGRADHGRDFILSVYDVLGAAQFSRDSKAGRAIDAGGMAHDWLSIVSTARAELQYLRVPGVIQRDLNRQQDGLIGFANRLFNSSLLLCMTPRNHFSSCPSRDGSGTTNGKILQDASFDLDMLLSFTKGESLEWVRYTNGDSPCLLPSPSPERFDHRVWRIAVC